MEQRLTIITLGVRNVKNATTFYETKFGWKKSDFSNEHISFFTLNGIMLALFETTELAKDATVNSKSQGFNNFTLAYNVTSEKEVDTIIKTLKNKGVKIVKPPQKVNWGGYSSYVADLDDNLWEIVYNPYLQLDSKGNVLE